MTEHFLLPGTVVLVWLPTVLVIVAVARRREVSTLRTLIAIAVVTWACAIVAASLFPFPLPPYLPDSSVRSPLSHLPNEWLNPYPFHTIGNTLRGIGSTAFAVGNVLAYVPLGVLIVAMDRHASLARAAAIALACSVGIEVLQFGISVAIGFPFRAADIDDVLLNVSGALAGYALGRIVIPTARITVRRAQRARTAP